MKKSQPSLPLRQKAKKSLCLILVLTMALGLLSACGNGTDNPNNTPTPDAPEYVYVPTYTQMSDKLNYINQSCYSNDRIYFVGEVYTGEMLTQSYQIGTDAETGEPIMEEYSYEEARTGIFSMALDGSDLQELAEYKQGNIAQDPDDPYSDYSYTGINRFFADSEGNLWLLENVYTVTFNLPDDFVESEASNAWEYSEQKDEYFLVKLDSNGKELSRLDLSAVGEDEEYFYVNDITVDKEGHIVLIGSGKIFVLDSDGKKLFSIDAGDSWIERLFALDDGRIVASLYDQTDGKMVLKTVDIATEALSEESYPCPLGAYDFITGNGEYDYYFNNGSSLFGVTFETAETEKIITWINCDVNSNNISNVIPMADGRVVTLSRDYSSDEATIELVTMVKTPSDEVPQKKIVTYACMWIDYYIQREIISFNRSNPDYRIEVMDYSEYNTQEDYQAGLTKLTTEILSGKVPDLFSTNGLPIDQYGAKGLLADLWPFIEGDTKLGGRDGVVQPVLGAMSTEDGKLYQIVPSATIIATVGASSVVGDAPGWTVEDALAALATMPEGCEMFAASTTRSYILDEICYMGLDSFVDWQTGECSFDTDEFIQLLEFAKLFPENTDSSYTYTSSASTTDIATADVVMPMPEPMYDSEILRIMEGRQLLSNVYVYNLATYLLYKEAFGGDITAVGMPGSTSGSAYSLSNGLAMSENCEYMDGAWQFMSIMLDEEYQTNYFSYDGVPTNKKVLDKKMKDLMTPQYYTDYETGEEVEQPKESWWIDDDNQLEVFALTQAEVDELMELINNTTRIYTSDQSLYDIIVEESAAFFAGQKSAQETARNIQSRVSLYVNEQR